VARTLILRPTLPGMRFLPRLFPVLLLAGVTAAPGEPLGIVAGVYTEFEAPFSPAVREFAGRPSHPCASTGAHAAVAVPVGFTPDRTWPVLLVSATSDPGYNSSRRLLRRFMAPALRAGWIVIAADATSERDEDTNNLRYALLVAALERLRLDWPDLPRWPRAFGGFSGGAKRSASLAAMSTILGRRPIGVFQGGCNEPVMSRIIDLYHPDKAQFLGVPVFLSSGSDDRIAPREQVEDVASDLRGAGFRHVRLERFTGGHELHDDHVEQALRWFVELAPRAAAP